MAGSRTIPLARSAQASSSAFFSSLTETNSGRCRSICPVNSSRLPPAASATTPNRSGSASTTERHCRPIEPVEPKMDSRFKDESFLRLEPNLPGQTLLSVSRPWVEGPVDLLAGRVDPNPIVPDNRDCQNQRIYPVKYAAMPRQKRSRIFDACAPLVSGFQEITCLTRDIPCRSHA